MNEQLTITDYFKIRVELRKVMDLTTWINAQGRAQYEQVGDIVKKYITDDDTAAKLTNAVSVYILDQSLGYMDYLRKESNGEALGGDDDE